MNKDEIRSQVYSIFTDLRIDIVRDKPGDVYGHYADAIMALFDKTLIDELRSLPRYSYPTETNMDREAVPAHRVDARIGQLCAPKHATNGDLNHGEK